MLKYAVSYISHLLDNLFEDAVKPSNDISVSGPLEYLIIKETVMPTGIRQPKYRNPT